MRRRRSTGLASLGRTALLLVVALLVFQPSALHAIALDGDADHGSSLVPEAVQIAPSVIERSGALRARTTPPWLHLFRHDAIEPRGSIRPAAARGLPSPQIAQRAGAFIARPKHVPRMNSEEPPGA